MRDAKSWALPLVVVLIHCTDGEPRSGDGGAAASSSGTEGFVCPASDASQPVAESSVPAGACGASAPCKVTFVRACPGEDARSLLLEATCVCQAGKWACTERGLGKSGCPPR